MADIKKRYWTFVLYPESAPEDWRQQLQLSGLMCAISPVHDRDVNPDGEVKKAHYHIILCYGNTTTYSNVKRLTDSLSQPIPQPLDQVRGMYRYFTHKDNPDKAQYSDDDIVSINGFDIRDFVDLTSSEVDNIKRSIQSLILELNITEYSVLMDYLLSYDNQDFYSVAASNTIFFNTYLSSRRNAFAASQQVTDISRSSVQSFVRFVTAGRSSGAISMSDINTLAKSFLGGD